MLLFNADDGKKSAADLKREKMKKIFCLMVAACLAACAVSPAGNDSLAGKWLVETVGGQTLTEHAELSFDTEQHTLDSYAGCNRMHTAYMLAEKGGLGFGYIRTTRMACDDEKMAAESRVSHAFTQTSAFRIQGGKLLLQDGEGKVLLQAGRAAGNTGKAEKRPSEQHRTSSSGLVRSGIHALH